MKLTIPNACTSLRVLVDNLLVVVEAPDGFVLCHAWEGSPLCPTAQRVSRPLCPTAQRVSRIRDRGPLGIATRVATQVEKRVAELAAAAFLRAVETRQIPYDPAQARCWRMILDEHIHDPADIVRTAWTFLPSFPSLAESLAAVARGEITLDDVESYGPMSRMVDDSALIASQVIAYDTRSDVEAEHVFAMRTPEGGVELVVGVDELMRAVKDIHRNHVLAHRAAMPPTCPIPADNEPVAEYRVSFDTPRGADKVVVTITRDPMSNDLSGWCAYRSPANPIANADIVRHGLTTEPGALFAVLANVSDHLHATGVLSLARSA